MKNEKEKIDVLLDQNAAEQFAGVDWDRLSSAISRRLDQVDGTLGRRYRGIFKVAAGLVAAAAIVLIVVMVRTDRGGIELADGQNAAVKFVKTKGAAKIVMKSSANRSLTRVSIMPAMKRGVATVKMEPAAKSVALCNVKIIEPDEVLRDREPEGSWIIISRPQPAVADNGISKDEMDLICML